VQSHPGKYREALGRLASALEAARGTPYEGTAAQALRQLSDEANAATRKKMEELDAQAAPLTDAGQFLEAAAVFENYDGPLAEETAGRRRAAAAALRARKTAADAAERGRESAAREKYTRTLDQVAETLLKEGIIAACSAVRDILGDQDLQRFQAELGAVRQLLEATAKINVRVLDSFRQQSGQTITVQLKNGAFSGTVAGVGETFVTLAIRLPVGEGRSERSFGVDDLAAKERLARLGPDGAPEVALAKGLMAAEAQAIESAASFFSSVGPPLGEVLVAKMRARGAKSSAAGSTEPSAQAEGEGAQRPPEPPRPIRLPPDLEAVRGNAAAVMSLLRRRNPALDEESIRTQAGEGGRINAIEIRSRSLTDLGPLAALPDLKSLSCGDPSAEEPSELKDVTPLRYTRLEQLSIVNAKLSDISALRTVPLQALCLARTQVREVSALRGMQLRHLELQGTRLFEGLPLAGLPLQYLDISGTQIKSISFTKGMPLETLLLADTGIYDFSLVPGLPVRELSLSDTQFRDLAMLKETGVRRLHLANGRFSSLAPLRGMNLEYLDVSGTRVTDFSSLAGMKLQTFIAANSALASLSFLSGMPLTTLIVPGTRVSDLDPIGDLSLTYLDISDTAVTDLAPLRGVPLVTLLCRNIPACNFGALRECPLQELYVDKPMRFMELLRQFPDLRLVNGESIEGLRGMRPRWRDPVNR
jgi:Leucine-rich repeat (LRR) protein